MQEGRSRLFRRRTMPSQRDIPKKAAPGREVMVTIIAAVYRAFGAVNETLPGGFDYVSSDPGDEEVQVTSPQVRFTQQGFHLAKCHSGRQHCYHMTLECYSARSIKPDTGPRYRMSEDLQGLPFDPPPQPIKTMRQLQAPTASRFDWALTLEKERESRAVAHVRPQ